MFFIKREVRVDLAHVFDVLLLIEVTLWFFEVFDWTFALESVVLKIGEFVLQTDLFCPQPSGNSFIILYLFLEIVLESAVLFFEQADFHFELFCLVEVCLAILGFPKLAILSLVITLQLGLSLRWLHGAFPLLLEFCHLFFEQMVQFFLGLAYFAVVILLYELFEFVVGLVFFDGVLVMAALQ